MTAAHLKTIRELPCCVCGKQSIRGVRGMCTACYQRWLPKNRAQVKPRAKYGKGTVNDSGYRVHCKNGIDVREHIAMAEAALGKPLPSKAVVHHVDCDRLNNKPENLVICPDPAYHMLIHTRMKALDAFGDANARKCCRCGTYDLKTNLAVSASQYFHQACQTAYNIAAQKRRQQRIVAARLKA